MKLQMCDAGVWIFTGPPARGGAKEKMKVPKEAVSILRRESPHPGSTPWCRQIFYYADVFWYSGWIRLS